MALSMKFHVAFFVTLSLITNGYGLNLEDIVITILSQNEGYHAAHADLLRRDCYEQAISMDKGIPHVVLTHELGINGSWTIIPLLSYLSYKYPAASWFLFCTENTVIRLNKIINLLSKYDIRQDLWLGHTLYDHEPTIIHHFAGHKKFKYPHIASGFLITSQLINRLVKRISENDVPKLDFSIDASYEFSTFVLNHNKGVRLTHIPELCIVSGPACATYPKFFHACGPLISVEKVYFAVKTCAKYHTERVSVIKATWAKHTKNIGYFSDAADHNLSDAYIVPNTTQGHCAKTLAILKQANYILKHRNLDWLIICDDDTIFSIARLLRLLTCYNPSNAIAIGERYGFRLWDQPYGYEYLTGGAGVVLSAPIVSAMVESNRCECPSATTPDDMYLFGICLPWVGVQPTHCPMFHQARPTDYASAFLAAQEPISFHKFWMIDPQMVYSDWFSEADSVLVNTVKHNEL